MDSLPQRIPQTNRIETRFGFRAPSVGETTLLTALRKSRAVLADTELAVLEGRFDPRLAVSAAEILSDLAEVVRDRGNPITVDQHDPAAQDQSE